MKKVALAILVITCASACSRPGAPAVAPQNKATQAPVQAPANENEINDTPEPEEQKEQSLSPALSGFLHYCYETKAEISAMLNRINSDGLREISDHAAAGYKQNPMTGSRLIFQVPADDGGDDAISIAITDMGACEVRVVGEGASTLPHEFTENFHPFIMQKPQYESGNVSVVIPSGKNMTEAEVSKKGIAVVTHLPSKNVASISYVSPSIAKNLAEKSR